MDHAAKRLADFYAMNATDLKRFCVDANDIRAVMMDRPWSVGDFTYATNGHIMLRVPRLADVSENERAPFAQKVMDAVTPATNWIPIPECAALPLLECDKCHGDGIYTCPTCEHDDECENCDGTGEVRQRKAIAVGDAHYDQHYLAMLQGYEIATNGPNMAARIRCGDVSGLLMPMRAA